jgi:tetratricopeptide (TPR) repeat protein
MNMTRRAFHLAAAGSLLRGLLTAQDKGVKVVGAAPGPGRAGAAAFDPSKARRRTALVIGNNAYKKARPLKNCLNDSDDIGDSLTKSGFTVTRVHDGSLDGTRAALSTFTSGLGQGDIALLYYSGHGIQANGENYIVPVDFDVAAGESRLAAAAIAAAPALEAMEKTGSQLNIVILDSCRDNPFRPNAPVKGMALMEPGLGTCVALATGPGQFASDNSDERNGLFTKFLIQEMGRPQPLDAVFKSVRDAVFKASAGKQRPWTFADIVGDFYFAQAAQSPVRLGVIDVIEQGKRQYLAGMFEEAADSFERAVRTDPENAFAYNALGSARARLKQWSIATNLFAKAIEIKPDYGAAYFNRGVAYYNASRYELALQDFGWAVEQEPYDPRALDLRGKTNLALRNNDDAVSDFSRSLELDPSDSTALTGRGAVRFRTGQFPDAIRDLSASLNIRVAVDALDLRAQCYKATRQAALADADTRAADALRRR